MFKLSSAGLAIAAAMLVGQSASAVPIIDQNFDSFPAGDFSGGIAAGLGDPDTTAGQWFNFGAPNQVSIDTTRSVSGSNSLKVTRGSADQVYGRRLSDTIDPTAVPGVQLSFYANRDSADGGEMIVGLSGAGAAFDFDGSIRWNEAGVIAVWDGSTYVATNNQVELPDDAWVKIDLLYEFADATSGNLTISATPVSTGVLSNVGTFAFSGYGLGNPGGIAILASNFTGASPGGSIATAYFDDVTLQAVPEPGSMALLGLGTVLVAMRRRSQR